MVRDDEEPGWFEVILLLAEAFIIVCISQISRLGKLFRKS